MSASGMLPDAISPRRARVPGDRGVDIPGDGGPAHSGNMHLGSVPFVSHRPRAFKPAAIGCIRAVADRLAGGV